MSQIAPRSAVVQRQFAGPSVGALSLVIAWERRACFINAQSALCAAELAQQQPADFGPAEEPRLATITPED